MDHLINASFRAIRSLFTPGMFGVFVLSIVATIGVLITFVGFSGVFFTWLAHALQGHSIATYLPWLGGFGSVIIAWVLFPGIMPVIVNFFDDRIARIIERNDYPAAPMAHAPRFWPELLHDMRFSLLVILLNLVVLPFYLLPLGPFVFYGLNGYLLGREFFIMAARRHLPVHEAEILRKQHGRTVLITGILLTLLATIPIINLFAPFWGIAVMVHLYHRFTATPEATLLSPVN